LINNSITNKTNNEEASKQGLSIDSLDFHIVEYPDFFVDNSSKKIKCKNLGEKFASINSFFLDYLKEYHIPTGYVKLHSKNSMKYIRHTLLPFSVKILNTADKRISKLFNLKEGDQLNLPIFEYHIGDSKDSLVSESHLIAFNFCILDDLKIMNRICSKVNAVLRSFFERRNEVLAEVNCIFGKSNDKLYLIDDFTPRSLKLFPANGELNKRVNPYKIKTASDVKNYTDYLHKLMIA
jgi:phosphoribosylaminoimidazole-succinocarboxamide synthase